MARRWLSRPGRGYAPDVAMAPAGLPPPAPGPAAVTTPDGSYSGVRACTCHAAKPPPPLGDLDDGAMVAVAAVPGKTLDEWRHAALGAWIARPDAAGDGHAEVMTAGQLRALLAGRNDG